MKTSRVTVHGSLTMLLAACIGLSPLPLSAGEYQAVYLEQAGELPRVDPAALSAAIADPNFGEHLNAVQSWALTSGIDSAVSAPTSVPGDQLSLPPTAVPVDLAAGLRGPNLRLRRAAANLMTQPRLIHSRRDELTEVLGGEERFFDLQRTSHGLPPKVRAQLARFGAGDDAFVGAAVFDGKAREQRDERPKVSPLPDRDNLLDKTMEEVELDYYPMIRYSPDLLAADIFSPPDDYRRALKSPAIEHPIPLTEIQAYVSGPDATGFTYGKVNTNKVISRLTELTGVPIEEIERRARPGAKSDAGFLNKTERLIDVLKKDNQFVLRKGLTHQQLAEPLFYAMNLIDHSGGYVIPEFRYKGRRYAVGKDEFAGSVNSIFNDRLNAACNFVVVDLETHQKIYFSRLLPYYIWRYGFYEGHTDDVSYIGWAALSPGIVGLKNYRVEPAQIIKMFGLR